MNINDDHIRKAFDSIDTNHDGVLQYNELHKAVGRAGVPLTAVELPNDKNATMTFEQFKELVLKNEEMLQQSFKDLDRDNSGGISLEELKVGLRNTAPDLEKVLDDSHFEKMMQRLDVDQNGEIGYSEWVAALALLPDVSTDAAGKSFQKAVFWNLFGEVASVRDAAPATAERIDFRKASTTLIAGGFAGAVSRTCTAPFDRLKTMLQAGSFAKTKSGHVGVIGGFKAIYNDGGVRAFWRGNGANIVKIVPENALKFLSFEVVKPLFTTDPQKGIKPIERLLAGSTAGIITQTFVYPLETIKTRLATSRQGEFKSILHCARTVIQEGGAMSLFRGISPALIGILPYAGIDLAMYETLRQKYVKSHNGAHPPTHITLGCAAASSTTAQLVSYPLALVRTKMQAGLEFKSMTQCFRHVIATDGFRGLYSGMIPNFMKVIPSCCIGYLAYEQSKTFIDDHWKLNKSHTH